MHLSTIYLALSWSFFFFSFGRAAITDNVADIQDIKFDFIIVGGGTAGNVVANRLSEDPKFNVLVIEAGPSHEGVLTSEVPWLAANNWFSQYDWNYTTVPQVGLGGRVAVLPRGHILGGSSSINFLVYTRSTIEDYDRIASITGDNGWSWDSLLPYFLKHERFMQPTDNHNITSEFNPYVHGFDGRTAVSLQGYRTPVDDRVIAASKQLGGDFTFVKDYNDGKPLGIGYVQTMVDGSTGKRSSSATSYLAPQFLKRPNLHVLVNAQVSRLIQSDNGTLPTFLTVEFRHASAQTQDRRDYNEGLGSQTLTHLTATREIIMCAGAIGTPHILLNSGIGDRQALTAVGVETLVDLPDVGANLIDHSAIANPWVVSSTDTFERLRTPNVSATLLAQWKANGTGPFVDTIASLAGFYRVTGDDIPQPDPAAGPNSPHFEHLFANGAIVPNAHIKPDQHIFSIGTALVSPTSRGSITINSTDPFQPPLIDPALLKEDADKRMMRAAIRHAFEFVSAPAFQGYILSTTGNLPNITSDANLDAYMGAQAGTFFHPTGTAAMSPKGSKTGVTDPDLRVKNVNGIRVVDASIFPHIPTGHTSTAVYVTAERAADIIKYSYPDY